MERDSDQAGPAVPAARDTSTIIRISTFGPLSIEWEGQAMPFPAERLYGRGAAPALSLLKALVCQPQRFALKDWIMEQLWPESARSKAEDRLEDVSSGLRCLLRPPGSPAKVLYHVPGGPNSGSGYRLEGYPQIWVDADAFVWYVEHAALLERFGNDALDYWEAAYHLAARGTFLPEEMYSDWAKERRETLEGHYRQCVHRLTYLLREKGAREQAMLRLRTYWEGHKTDEDALRPLMELLSNLERYQEAETYYTQTRVALKEDGHEPDPRTRDIIEYIRALQIQRPPAKNPSAKTAMVSMQDIPVLPLGAALIQPAAENPSPVTGTPALLWQVDLHDPLMAPRFAVWSFLIQEETRVSKQKLFYDRMISEIMAFPYGRSPDQVLLLEQSVYDVSRKYDGMHSDHVNGETQLSRRHALRAIAQFPIQLYGLTAMGIGQGTLPPAEEALPLFAAGMATCWRHYTPEGMQVVRGTLSAYLPTLERFARQSSPYQQAAAHLASQGYLLACLIAEYASDLQLMEAASGLALFYGQLADDPNLEAAALVRRAVRFGFSNRHLKSLEVYQEAVALPAFARVSPLLQGRVYAGLAGKLAACQRTAEARAFLDRAKETYPLDPWNDPSYAFASCGQYSLAYFEGMVFEQAGQYVEAATIFQRYASLTPLPGVPEANRSEHLTHLAQIAIKQRDPDTASLYLDAAEEISWALQHEGLHHDQREMQSSMQSLWPDEPKVKALQEKMRERRF